MQSRLHNDTGAPESVDSSTAESVDDAVFGGSRFMAWTIGPVAAIAAFGLALGPWAGDRTSVLRAVVVAILLLLALAVFAPRRCAFAARIVTGFVFVTCLLYVVEMAIDGPDVAAHRGEKSLGNALQAFLVFGIPCFWLTVRRRRR